MHMGSRGYDGLKSGKNHAAHSSMHNTYHFTWVGQQLDRYIGASGCLDRGGVVTRLTQIHQMLENYPAHRGALFAQASVASNGEYLGEGIDAEEVSEAEEAQASEPDRPRSSDWVPPTSHLHRHLNRPQHRQRRLSASRLTRGAPE